MLTSTQYDEEVVVKGWVRTKRGSKNVVFLAMNDGSSIHTIQIVVNVEELDKSF